MAERKFIIETAGFWFQSAREAQQKGDLATALLCMENALNHTENALGALLRAAREMPRATPKAGAAYTIHDFKIEAAAVWDLDRTLKMIDGPRQAENAA